MSQPIIRCARCGRFMVHHGMLPVQPCKCGSEIRRAGTVPTAQAKQVKAAPVKAERRSHTDLVLDRLGTLLEGDHLTLGDKAKVSLAVEEIKELRRQVASAHREYNRLWEKDNQRVDVKLTLDAMKETVARAVRDALRGSVVE